MDPNVIGVAGLAILFFGGIIGYKIGTGRIKVDLKKTLEKISFMIEEDVETAIDYIKEKIEK